MAHTTKFLWIHIPAGSKSTFCMTSSSAVISKLKRHFSVHGTLQSLFANNARKFASQHFKEFAKQWDFIHGTISPKFPQSNGLAERLIRAAKQLMEKSQMELMFSSSF